MSNERNQQVQATIAAALARSEPLSVAECNLLIIDLSTALGNAGERASRTAPAGNRTPPGADYLKALKTGTGEDVRKVEEEHESSRILAAQLQAQRDELFTRRTAMAILEAKRDMPKLQGELVGFVTKAEAAKEALVRALAAVRKATEQVYAARVLISRESPHEAPEGGATVHTLRRLWNLDSAFLMDDPFTQLNNRERTCRWLDHLGCAVTEKVMQAAWAKAPGVDFSDCTSDADVHQKAVVAVKGESALLDRYGKPIPESEMARVMAFAFESLRIQERSAA